MPETGQLGTADSKYANVEYGKAPSPPPPPPPPPTVIPIVMQHRKTQGMS